MPVSRTVKCSVTLGIAIFFALNIHHHFALIGELDGVTDKIDEHLTQADGITAKPAGHIGMNVPGQFKLLRMGARAKRFEHVAQFFAHIEIDRFQFQFAGFDLGEVQNLVDDRQQRFGRFGNDVR